MNHQIFKVLDLHYIHLDDKHLLCPLADFLALHSEVDVLEVRYNPQIEQGVVIVRTDTGERLEKLIDFFKKMML